MQPQAAVYRKKNNLLAEPALLIVTTIALFAELHIKLPTIAILIEDIAILMIN